MSRRSRRRRETLVVPSETSTRSLTSLLRTTQLVARSMVDVEDRRRHHPLMEWAPPLTYSGNPARITHKNKFSRPHKMAGFTVPGVPKKLAFKNSKKTLLCVRRSQRKEVLFALARTGKGSRSKRKHNRFSEISC